MKVNFINHILTEGRSTQLKLLSIQPGQVITGKILKLFPNNMAALQVGAQKIAAQLEAPLEAGKLYWFQVLPGEGEGKPRLKVLVHAQDSKQEIPHTALLKQLSLPLTEENQSIIRFLLKEQLPVNKEIFQLTGELTKDTGLKSIEMEALKLLINKQLPLTKASFDAVVSTLNDDSFSQLVKTLTTLLHQNSYTESGEKLLTFLENMSRQVAQRSDQPEVQINSIDGPRGANVNAEQSFAERPTFVQYLKEMMKHMGFSYEQELVHFFQHDQVEREINRDALKPLLLDFLQDDPVGIVRETAEKILNKITGIQLFGTESGPLQQLALQIPIMIGQKTVDLTMQWSGKKQENGQIDPAYCRILFYIELLYLEETIVDMQVQNRVIRLQVINEHTQLKELAAPFIEGLKENLELMNFSLSAVQFTRPSESASKYSAKQNAASLFNKGQHYSGVDIKI